MPNFRYEIKQGNGKTATGVIDASSSGVAAQQLRARGGYITSLTELASARKGAFSGAFSFSIQRGPSAKDVLNFTTQLAVMIKAGISIRAALEGIADQMENPKFRDILESIRRDVESGKPFSEALARYPKVFGGLYVNMVRASEMSGSFAGMLERIASYQAQQIETRSQVRGAMIYPIIIAVMAVVTTVFLLTFVLPRFLLVFEGKEHLLPSPTKIILHMSYIMRTYWYILLAVTTAAGYGFWYFIHTAWGRQW